MYIAPNTKLKILRGVDLDRNYAHTRRFITATEQYEFFTNTLANYDTGIYVKYSCGTGTGEMSPISYQRWEKNSIRINIKCDDLYDCNYLMFQNTSFGNKWFYAFIDTVEYVNNTTTTIHYTIDVIQTWMFDFKVEHCFVEREHTKTDVVGGNTIPEDFSVGEYVNSSSSTLLSGAMLGGIILNKPASSIWYNGGGNDYYPICDDLKTVEEQMGSGWNSGNRAQTGIVDGLYIYTGFSLITLPESPSDRDDYYYQWAIYDDLSVASLSTFINALAEGKLHIDSKDGDLLTAENVIAVFQYPKEFSKKSYAATAASSGLKSGFSQISVTPPMGTYFYGKIAANDYAFSSVKNKKMLTYPFLKLKAYSNTGIAKEYKYEMFRSNSTYSNGVVQPLMYLYGNIVGKADLTLLPVNYKSVFENYEEKVSYQYTYNPLYKGNAYAEYMQRHGNSVSFGFVASALNFVGGVINGLGRSTPTAKVGGVVQSGIALVENVGTKIANLKDIEQTPPTSYYNSENDLFSISKNIIGYIIRCETIDGETAKIIDDYFNMFGYAIKQNKIPNIFENWQNANLIRPYWNYVKTAGAILHPTTGKGIPAEVEKEITAILDRGITFWNTKIKTSGSTVIVEIGDYSMDNSPT